MFSGKTRASVEAGLAEYLQEQRWFGGKAREIKSATFAEVVPVNSNSTAACITQVEVEYTEEDKEVYMLPLAFASGDKAAHVLKSFPASVFAEVTVKQKGEERKGVIYDGVYDEDFCKSLVEMFCENGGYAANAGNLLRRPRGLYGTNPRRRWHNSKSRRCAANRAIRPSFSAISSF